MTTNTATDLHQLRTAVRGPVWAPYDDGYASEVAAHNRAITHQPDLVVGATCTDDVVEAVRYAAAHGLPVAVQGTGHGAVATIRDAILVSTRRMDAVTVHPTSATVRVTAGVTWDRVLDAAAAHGLAPLNGSSPSVGVIGYTTGGGVGPLGRAYGFAADHVRRLELVTADGERREVDRLREPELFWAVRGGKGAFGVVTAMDLNLFPVARIYGGGVFYPGEAAGRVLHAYREWVATLPEQITTSVALLRLPALPNVPEPLRGRFVVHLRVAHLGDAAAGARLLAPMRAAAPIVMDTVTDMPYRAVGTIHNDPLDPAPYWSDGILLRELPAPAVDALLDLAGPGVESRLTAVEIRHLGGALGRQSRPGNAVGGRNAPFSLFAAGGLGPGPAGIVADEGQRVLAGLAPWGTGGTQINLLGAPDQSRVQSSWPPDVYRRLQAVKRMYDPHNLFRHGHTVRAEASS